MLRYNGLGLQFGAGFSHTNNAVPVSRQPTGPVLRRGATQGFAKPSSGSKFVSASNGLNVSNNNNTEVIETNKRSLCQKCTNVLGSIFCCGRKGGRRTRKSKILPGKSKKSRRK
jgi:hypothetical protein